MRKGKTRNESEGGGRGKGKKRREEIGQGDEGEKIGTRKALKKERSDRNVIKEE